MNRIESFWDKMSGKYDRHAAAKYADAYEKTLNISKEYLNKSDVALDFASGTGITTIPLAGCVKEIDALDISPKMLEIAEKKARDNNVQNIRFLVGSLFDSPLQQNHYDVVMAFNVLYFFEDIPQVLSRIHALLKPGGVFLSATDCLGKRS
ncbi:MAG: class I SAM-dependent methyltransferase, partial [Eubacteriales bacterium]